MQNTSSVSAFDLTDAYFSGVLSDIELFVFCFVPFHILKNIVVQEKITALLMHLLYSLSNVRVTIIILVIIIIISVKLCLDFNSCGHVVCFPVFLY